MKKYLIIIVLLMCKLSTNAQTVAFPDMADLLRLSVGQVDNILIATGNYKLNSKEEISGQIISSYQSIDKNKKVIKGETLITGAYETTGDGSQLHHITYRTIYPEYIQNLMKQIKKYGYRLTFKGADPSQDIYIFDNPFNHVTVYMRTDHSINSVEVKQKDVSVD